MQTKLKLFVLSNLPGVNTQACSQQMWFELKYKPDVDDPERQAVKECTDFLIQKIIN